MKKQTPGPQGHSPLVADHVCAQARPMLPASLLAGLLCVFVVICAWAAPASAARQGSWLLDEQGYARSAHADLDCVQCHEGLDEAVAAGDHPAPDELFKERTTAFAEEGCLSCHPQVEEERARGLHAGKPVPANADMQACVSCHDPHLVQGREKRTQAAELSEESQSCLSCHGQKAVLADSAPRLCLSCHDRGESATHTSLSCLSCHDRAAAFPHTDVARVECTSCHTRHPESLIHDAHTRVDCMACHGAGSAPAADRGQVGAVTVSASLVHKMDLAPGTDSCTRCHDEAARPQGKVLAVNSVLPPKSVLCAACHAATLTVQDTPSQLGLGVFGLGFAGMLILWLSSAGLGQARTERTATATHDHTSLPGRLVRALGNIFFQTGLFRESRRRWAIHALIFFPFVLRAGYGLAASLGAGLAPESAWPWQLLAKDWPLTAFVNDFCGLLLLLGLVLACFQQKELDARTKPANTPKSEWLVLYLLLAITVTGFVAEGVRIALDTLALGAADTSWSFVGVVLAKLFEPLGAESLAGLYGKLWYLHAIVTALTVACIPFTRLRHIFTTPFFLIVQALGRR